MTDKLGQEPAFPQPNKLISIGDKWSDGSPIQRIEIGTIGLTKREWFAGMAMIGIMAANPHSVRTDFQERASKAFYMADAMLKEAEK